MIIIEKKIPFKETYPLERLGKREDMLFFDIETTGFSGEHSVLYLIGCVYFKDNAWSLIQWFADSPDSESAVLKAFFEFLKGYRMVIHFNGDGFDIPYLLKRCLAHGLSYNFSAVESLDIYKKVRPYKGLLGLESMKQKSIEAFLNVSRRDLYSGGQLIEVYKDYLVSHDKFLFDLLILHNEDDLKGMPLILPVLNYPDFFGHNFTLEHEETTWRTDRSGKKQLFLKLICKNGFSIPVPFSKVNSFAVLTAQNEALTAVISLYEGELKYFYPDYKNYYYLIYEDRAIHKSIAEYVDKEARIKAAAKTCYLKQSGLYLPQLSPLWTPFLQKEYKDKITYIPYRQEFFADSGHVTAYISHLLDGMTK